MKRLNNKGFAISTIIYGLSIMVIMIVAILMATMAQTRSNTKTLSKQIEEELNRFSKTETQFLPQLEEGGDKPTSQEFIAPEDGWYRIELWGSQGGGTNGGNGAYTSGVIELKKGETLFFYVGKHTNGSVGRETDVRIVSGGYNNYNSYETRIMVAAGGGTDSNAAGGTLYGYNSKMKSSGGAIKVGKNATFDLLPANNDNTTNGTLVGYPKNFALETSVTAEGHVGEAIKPPLGKNGGGDGYWPSESASVGGASFIAGYSGCYGLEEGKIKNNSRFRYYPREYEEDEEGNAVYVYNKTSDKVKNYYFVDGFMMAGVNKGDGHAQIQRVVKKTNSSQTLTRKNTKLDSVRYIKDCVEGASNADINAWPKLIATEEGVTVNAGITPTVGGGCRTYDLGAIHKLDEIATTHKIGTDSRNNIITVSSDNSTWLSLKGYGTGTTLSTTETPTGTKISAYQYDATAPFPLKGNYVLLPVLYENKVVSAAANAEQNANPLTVEYYNGYKRQIWAIELVTDTKISPGYVSTNSNTYEYKITELARFKGMTSAQDENIPMNYITATDIYNKYARNEPQLWKIKPVGNGTYTIQTVVPAFDPSIQSGMIVPQSNQSSSDRTNEMIIGLNCMNTVRFTMLAVDYSAS